MNYGTHQDRKPIWPTKLTEPPFEQKVRFRKSFLVQTIKTLTGPAT